MPITAESRQQKAAATKRNRTLNAFLDAAETEFANLGYAAAVVERAASNANLSTATFYSYFTGRGALGAAVLDRRLNRALDLESGEPVEAPHARLLGNLGLLGDISAPWPGITRALIDERTGQLARPYSELLPRYYAELTGALRDGQEQEVFRSDLEVHDMAEFALDSLAMAYAVPLGDTRGRGTNAPFLVLNGLRV
jgi:AcrR family transcriptional regulator